MLNSKYKGCFIIVLWWNTYAYCTVNIGLYGIMLSMKDINSGKLAQVFSQFLERTPEVPWNKLMTLNLIVSCHVFFTSLFRDDLYQLVSLFWLHLQVVLCHGSRNYSRSLVLIGQLCREQIKNYSYGFYIYIYIYHVKMSNYSISLKQEHKHTYLFTNMLLYRFPLPCSRLTLMMHASWAWVL